MPKARVLALETRTPKAFVIGWPIAHSRSPLIHGYWLEHYGIAGSYEKIAVAPEELATFIKTMRENGFVGGNVTIPHKEAAVALCDRLTPSAERLGVVNTLWFEGDLLCGDTTDGQGFVAALDQEAPAWNVKRHRAVVLGAGGAARAIVDAIKKRGFDEIVVASRTMARSAALADQLSCQAVDLRQVSEAFGATSLLVNTTPAGMHGHAPLDIEVVDLPSDAIVDDIVYVPRETPLLRAAQARGLRTVGGLGMLLHQAVPGFEHWFETKPMVTPELRVLVEADIAGRDPAS